MRPLAPELLPAATRPLEAMPARPTLPAEGADWSNLAAGVAEATEPAVVAAAVRALADSLGADVDLDADLVVLQRTFGLLHRRAVSCA